MTKNQIDYQRALAEIELNKQKAEQQRLQNVDTELANAVKHWRKYGIEMEPAIAKYKGHYGNAWLEGMMDTSHEKIGQLWDMFAPVSKFAKR